MTDVRLQENTPNTTWVEGAYTSIRHQVALRFQVQTPGWVRSIRWYQVTGGQLRPTKLGLYNGAQALIWSDVAVPEDVGVPGWQVLSLDQDIQLAVGQTYSLAMDTPPTGTRTNGNPADRPAAPLPFLWDDNPMWSSSSGMPTFPATVRTDQVPGLDLVWTDLSPILGLPPVGASNAREALADWFDTVIATEPGADPGLYPMAAAELTFVPAGGATRMLPRLLSHALAIIAGIADLAAVAEIIRGWLDPTPGGTDSAVRRSDGTTVLDDTQGLIAGQNALEAQLNTMQAQLTALGEALSTAEGAIGAFPVGWTLLAEEDFVSNIAFAEPAHLYVLTVTDYPPTTGNVATAAGLWLPRLGWWTESNGSQAGARGFVEFQQQQLHAGGRAMAGCAIQLKTGTLATIQAWGAP
jgi:uncharacterized protein DUF4082